MSTDEAIAILFGLGVVGWLFDRGADAELEHQRAIGDELVEPERPESPTG